MTGHGLQVTGDRGAVKGDRLQVSHEFNLFAFCLFSLLVILSAHIKIFSIIPQCNLLSIVISNFDCVYFFSSYIFLLFLRASLSH